MNKAAETNKQLPPPAPPPPPAPAPPDPCIYCQAVDAPTLKQAIAALLDCTNCLVDLQMNGGWTGRGLSALQWLGKVYGVQAVIDAYEECLAQQNKRDDGTSADSQSAKNDKPET